MAEFTCVGSDRCAAAATEKMKAARARGDRYFVGASHEAFGREGERAYHGTERGARIIAGRIARAAGHGWVPYVHFAPEL